MIERSITAIAALAFAGCGHAWMRETVVRKVNSAEAHVCLDPGSFSVGDRVILIDTRCWLRIDRTADCHGDLVGHGRITRVINEHYAAIELVEHSQLEEGVRVEIVR